MIRTKVDVMVSRTIQLKSYEPYTVSFTATVENPEGVPTDKLELEAQQLSDIIDKELQRKIDEEFKSENS